MTKPSRSSVGGQSGHSGSTAERLAKEYGVSARTIRRDGKFVEAIDKLKSVAPDIERQLAHGGPAAPTRKNIMKAAELVETDPERAKAVLAGTDEKPERTQQAAFDEFAAGLNRLVGKSLREFPDLRQSIKSQLQLVTNSIKP